MITLYKQDLAGTGWSYRAKDATLTLTGYNGGTISCEEDLNVIYQATTGLRWREKMPTVCG